MANISNPTSGVTGAMIEVLYNVNGLQLEFSTSVTVVSAVQSTSNTVQGNYIGTNASGTAALGNTGDGILVLDSAGALLAGNIIAGNKGNGIEINGSNAADMIVENNDIGTNATGTANLGNGGAGVWIANGASSNQIGGSAALGDTIAFNTGAGVVVTDPASIYNHIVGNEVYSNTLGINLLNGANSLQSPPSLTAAVPGATTKISGSLTAAANTTYTLDVYASAAADSAGNVEGGRYLGATTVITNASGTVIFNSVTINAASTVGDLITATATDPSGNTSAFSAIPSPAVLSSTTTTITPDNNHLTGSTYGQMVTFAASVVSDLGTGTPTGTVQFLIDNVNYGSAIQLVNGSASISLNSLTASTHTIEVDYTSNDATRYEDSIGTIQFLVNPVPLTIIADNKSKVYGTPNPALTFTSSGFVNGDTLSSLPVQPSLTTTATNTSAIGVYPIIPYGPTTDGTTPSPTSAAR